MLMLEWLGIIVAIATATIPFGYQYFKSELREDITYRKKVAKSLTSHAYLEEYRDRLGAGLAFFARWLGDLYSWRGAVRGLSVCYVLALGYTSIFFVLSWSLDGPVGLGSFEVLPSMRQRWIYVLYILISTSVVAISIASAFGVVAAVFGSMAIVGSITLGASIDAVYVFAIILGLFIFFSSASNRSRGRYVFSLIIGGLFAAVANVGPNAFGVYFFLALLPLANMVLDWPSWWISRWLGQHLLDQTGAEMRTYRKVLVIVSHALLDLAAAIVFLFLLAMALSLFIEVAGFWAGVDLKLHSFIDMAVQDPWPNAVWVGAMLLSTLAPTLLHAGVLTASPLALWLQPSNQRAQTAFALTKDDEPEPWAVRSAAWFLVRFWVTAIMAPLVMLCSLVGVVYLLTGSVAEHLVWAAEIGIWLVR